MDRESKVMGATSRWHSYRTYRGRRVYKYVSAISESLTRSRRSRGMVAKGKGMGGADFQYGDVGSTAQTPLCRNRSFELYSF